MRQLHIPTQALTHEPIETDQIVADEQQATAGYSEFAQLGGTDIGIWEMSTGTMQDVEADEVFVVISGRGSIEFQATGETIEIAAGDLVRLTAGERTVWRVSETLRKVYISA